MGCIFTFIDIEVFERILCLYLCVCLSVCPRMLSSSYIQVETDRQRIHILRPASQAGKTQHSAAAQTSCARAKSQGPQLGAQAQQSLLLLGRYQAHDLKPASSSCQFACGGAWCWQRRSNCAEGGGGG